ncbi:hypothetical protein K491DRAFT_682669 [Lophiostoma macrostomum CBS 122681]|uniref:Uncharacterized protein n=1 Tax=Lophiostoma macrostomum CBS 122681 TaxID=1314788 RepID=A0A6A6ST45_9PLEO|nr:hypothetical protein K491DRAFT_682669 [Lophiostoma macrostomum CBS 122681]
MKPSYMLLLIIAHAFGIWSSVSAPSSPYNGSTVRASVSSTATPSSRPNTKASHDNGSLPHGQLKQCSFDTTEERALETFILGNLEALGFSVYGSDSSFNLSAFPTTLSIDSICSGLDRFLKTTGVSIVPVCWSERINIDAEAVAAGCDIVQDFFDTLEHREELGLSLQKTLKNAKDHRDQCANDISKKCQEMKNRVLIIKRTMQHLEDTKVNLHLHVTAVSVQVNATNLAKLNKDMKALKGPESEEYKRLSELIYLRSEMSTLAQYQNDLEERVETRLKKAGVDGTQARMNTQGTQHFSVKRTIPLGVILALTVYLENLAVLHVHHVGVPIAFTMIGVMALILWTYAHQPMTGG